MVSGDLGEAGGGVEFWRAEAERLAADNAALRARVADLEGQVEALAEKVSMLARLAFGTSSEKAAKPVSGGDGAGDDAGDGKVDKRGRGQRKGSRGHGRRDYSHLPTREEVHDVPEAERVCPRCGTGYAPFGQESCEQIDWQVQLTRIVHRRPTYRRTCGCPVRGVLVAAAVPKAIGKGRFTTGFLARLLVEKFVLGRPAHRIIAALAHDGFDLAEGTLAGGRELLLSSDFYVVYQILGRVDGVDNLWCWSHIRRYFIRAGDAHPELAAWTAGWIERIAELYMAHTAMGAAEPGSTAHTWAAAQFSAALNTIDAERTAQMSHAALLHPAAAKVLATLDREWGTGWPATANSPNWPWTTTPPSGRCAGRWSAARTTTAPARWSPRSWPAESSRSPQPPPRPGSTRWATCRPTSTNAPRPGAPPPPVRR